METEENNISQNNGNIFGQVWAKYFPYWPIFLFLIILSITSTWFYLKRKLPIYESSATLLLKDEKKGAEDSKMTASLNMLSSNKLIENEMEVIKSRALLGQVVNELKLYATVYQKGQWADLPAYSTSPIKIDVQNPDSLIEVNHVDFIYDALSKTVTFNGRPCQLGEWVKTPWGNLKFLINNENYNNRFPLYFTLTNPKRVVQNLGKSIEVTSVGKLSTVINIKLKDQVPARSENILNSLIAAYDRAAVNDKNSLAINTLSFLDERLKYVTNDLDSIEKKLQQYRTAKGAIDISSQGRLFLQNVSDNDQKLSDVNMKLSALDQVEKYITVNDSRGGLVPSTLGIEDPMLTSLISKLYDYEVDHERLKKTTGENSPDMIALNDQIQKIKPSVLELIHNQQRNLEANKNSIHSTNNIYNSQLSALPQQERDLVEISRQQNIKESIYSFLLQKREETAISNSSTVSDSRVVDKAESSLDPIGMDSKLIYGTAILLAIGLGVTLVVAREMFSSKVLFRNEIETITTLPVIGEVVQERQNNPMVMESNPSGFASEQFRLLRTSLSYLGIGPATKKILVTSTISGEGKSFIAANLAFSLSATGKKTVLVEFDLSNPTLSHKLKIDKAVGVANYLSGSVDITEIIKHAISDKNLSFIPAGNLPANPSELILSERTGELLSFLENKFDYIVVDSAPVGLLSDGYVLSKQCDATLYVVRHRHTPKKMLERLDKNIKINELKNPAIVFNGVRSRGFGKNGYGYGYGYGYVYNQKKN